MPVDGWFKLLTLEEVGPALLLLLRLLPFLFLLFLFLFLLFIFRLFLPLLLLLLLFLLLLLLQGEFYNVPVTAEGEDLAANLKKLRVSSSSSAPPDTFLAPPKSLSGSLALWLSHSPLISIYSQKFRIHLAPPPSNLLTPF